MHSAQEVFYIGLQFNVCRILRTQQIEVLQSSMPCFNRLGHVSSVPKEWHGKKNLEFFLLQ
jgi:hypothetical protein